MTRESLRDETGLEIAVIGASGRFPGAENIEEFWGNLERGVESISFVSPEELLQVGETLEHVERPDYVKAIGSVLENAEYFDAAFFNYIPAEAQLMDPQTRVFHECAWEALENAGYEPFSFKGTIGLYAGTSPNFHYQVSTMLSKKKQSLGNFELLQLINKDFLCIRVSYKLNLRGPSLVVHSTCSTSLAAIHTACRALLTAECDMALAGGISLRFLGKTGYLYQEGMIYSPDGHCRVFDANAKGTISGSGGGIVVLKKLKAAVIEHDTIIAVIKGSVINNDGIRKVGFTAPSIDGQVEVIEKALYISRVEPETIGYLEAHGTGTTLGDPVEVEALKLAFHTDKKGFCALGSVKANIGHLDAAAGVAGFLKAALALKYRLIPPVINFKTPNPKINLEHSPFYVNTQPIEWKRNGYPRRAAVSSFGIGGTNVHLILEEAPENREECTANRGYHLVLLSARTKTALEKMTKNLVNHFKKHPGMNLADAVYTLQVGRKLFPYKRMSLCPDVTTAIERLSSKESDHTRTFYSTEKKPVIFMFSGQGSQYENMGIGLYQSEPAFREEINRCFEVLKPILGYDIKKKLYPATSHGTLKESAVNQTEIAQPLIFIFEYTLAKLLMNWGIQPHAMIGHSIGEYTAACLSGVLPLEDALKLVACRGRLMQNMPPGVMLSVPLDEGELIPLLNEEISLAAVNGSARCVVSGPSQAIEAFSEKLKEKGCQFRRLHTSHAFHSGMMDPILDEFEREVARLTLKAPGIPYISNISGRWISAKEAANPGYWRRHLRQTVRFGDGIKELLKIEGAIFLEIGPGKALSDLVMQRKDRRKDQFVLNTVRHPLEHITDQEFLLHRLGLLCLYNVPPDWDAYYSGENRNRIPLPTYPFERKRYRVEENLLKMALKQSNTLSPAQIIADPEPTPNKYSTEFNDDSSLYERPESTIPYVPPKNEIEQKLVYILENFLGVDKIGTIDDFSQLGIDSLKTMAIGLEIYKEFDVKIPIEELLTRSNVKDIAKLLLNSNKTDGISEKPQKELTDHRLSLESNEVPKNIFLTGATGFCGAHMLKYLIDKTDARIFCLVRGGNLESASRRANDIWSFYFDSHFKEHFGKRLFVIQGDITKSRLGMDIDTYNRLARQMDTVIHCAAIVSHFGKYETFRAINIVGTQRVIDFCFSGVEKKLHHISTLAVIGTPSQSVNLNESEWDFEQTFAGNVYARSKFEAEKLVFLAKDRDLKASVYRIGNLVGRFTDGVFQKNIETNQLYSDIKAIISLGKIPSSALNSVIEMSPVDICSQAIVELLLAKKTIGSVFHLNNPHPLSIKKFIDFVNRAGFVVEIVDPQNFSNAVHSSVRTDNFNKEISGIFYSLRDEPNDSSRRDSQPIVTFDNTFTVKTLLKNGFSWFEPDFNYIVRMLKYLIDIGYLSPGKNKKMPSLT